MKLQQNCLKQGGGIIHTEIHIQINSIWNKEELIQDWGQSIIVPVCKKCDKTNCSNYRGISLLPPYLLTPWSRVLLEKLASLQLVKKFPAFYGPRRFLTALTSARHLSLS